MNTHRAFKIGVLLLSCSALSACGASERLAQIGKAPEMTKIANPVTQEDYQPVSMPMPAPKNVKPEKNSLWASDRTTFFKDQRAKDVGDIITVMIEISDNAEIDNESERTRTSDEKAGLNALAGTETFLNDFLPGKVDNTDLVDGAATSNYKGSGSVDREEKVNVQLAALITQILPNGNMVLRGRQEVVVNFEKRILEIDGVIRPEDISVQNTVSYEKIAEARIAYGGEGDISDVQQPRYGQQLYDIIFPF